MGMTGMRVLSHIQAARFYDMLGAGLDTQAFYETAALRDLITHLDLESCRSLIELGFGTGRLAAELLSRRLSPEATYFGLDVSTTMVNLTKSRLRPFGQRAEVRQFDGTPHIDAADATFDRFISTYVFDLLSDDDIRAVLKEARRVLKPDGMLGVVSLTNGPSPISRLVSTTWRALHRVSPWLVGGCRPITIRTFLSNTQWQIRYANIVVRFGIPSEIVVARPVS
jgi:ubiquinone/menaquinone biosynthesis C-methylase UbiE